MSSVVITSLLLLCTSNVIFDFLTVCVGLSVEFARALFRVWLQEKDVQNVAAALKRAGLESKLMV